MRTGAAEGVGYLGAAIWGEVRLPGGRRGHAARLGSGTLSGDCRWGGCTGPNRGASRGRSSHSPSCASSRFSDLGTDSSALSACCVHPSSAPGLPYPCDPGDILVTRSGVPFADVDQGRG